MPVMVFLHGGLFNGGSASPRVYGPELLVDRDVVRRFTMDILYTVASLPDGTFKLTSVTNSALNIQYTQWNVQLEYHITATNFFTL